MAFFADTWKTLMFPQLLVYITSGLAVDRLQYHSEQLPPTVTTAAHLRSDHEEADTRLLLHANDASDAGYDHVIIRSPDTDVAVIAMSLQDRIKAHLYFATGVKDKSRLLSIKTLCGLLGPATSRGLIGLHALSGCDSTSSFHGKGKRSVLLVARQNPEHMKVRSGIV